MYLYVMPHIILSIDPIPEKTYLCFLRVEPHAHANVLLAALAPNVVRHLEPDDKDAPVHLAGPLAERVHAMVAVQRAVHLGIKVGRVVEVLALAFSHYELYL